MEQIRSNRAGETDLLSNATGVFLIPRRIRGPGSRMLLAVAAVCSPLTAGLFAIPKLNRFYVMPRRETLLLVFQVGDALSTASFPAS